MYAFIYTRILRYHGYIRCDFSGGACFYAKITFFGRIR